jgi:hypothetical protein
MSESANHIRQSSENLKTSISNVDWDKLGTFTASANVPFTIPTFRKIERLTTDISKTDFNSLDNESLARFAQNMIELESTASSLISESNSIGKIDFQFNQNSVNTRGFQLVRKFHESVREFLSITEAMGYLENSSPQVVANIAKADIQQEAHNFRKWLGELKESVAQKEAALKYSGIFKMEADKYRTASHWWLAFTITLLTLATVSAFYLLNSFPLMKDNNVIVQFTISKVLITIVLFYAINMCLKNFRAQRHNQVVNEHRHNALETFDLFQKSTNDDQTKNAVLLEVTRTIFGNQHTGYTTSNDSDSDTVPSKIIEIIKQSPR